MINLAVINLKRILKKLGKLILIIIIIEILFNSIKIINKEKINLFSTFSIASTEKNIEKSISIAQYFGDENKVNESKIKKILERELALFSTTEEKMMEKENQEEVIEFEKDKDEIKNIDNKNEEIKLAESNIKLEEIPNKAEANVIEENNKTDKYTDEYKTVKIRNESKYTLTESMLTPNYELKNKKDIIIFHTHTCESYTKSQNENYEETGNFRTTNLEYNVAKVGAELSNNLEKLGYNVTHNLTYHDYPAYTGSYSRSLKTVKSILEQNKDAEFIIDLHRDALRK